VHSIPSDPENESELARASITGPAYYLLRPDGHIGLAGTRFEESAVRNWFASRSVHNETADVEHSQPRVCA
jgi:hypothetical protein